LAKKRQTWNMNDQNLLKEFTTRRGRPQNKIYYMRF